MRAALVLALLALFSCGRGSEVEEKIEPASPPDLASTPITFGGSAPLRAEEVRSRLAPVHVHDAYERHEVTFLAVPAVDLLDERFGHVWREADEVVFACADGYRAGVPVERLVAQRAHLAFAREGAEFAIDKPEGGERRRVALAPSYLVWEAPEGGSPADAVDWEWPYQIVSVELASFEARYARITPRQPASDEVSRGFETFRHHCVRCHAINGQGGRVGPELNYPASVTEYMREDWITRFILDPTSVRHGTAMPGLPAHLEEREARARELVAYLEAMVLRKLAPGED